MSHNLTLILLIVFSAGNTALAMLKHPSYRSQPLNAAAAVAAGLAALIISMPN